MLFINNIANKGHVLVREKLMSHQYQSKQLSQPVALQTPEHPEDRLQSFRTQLKNNISLIPIMLIMILSPFHTFLKHVASTCYQLPVDIVADLKHCSALLKQNINPPSKQPQNFLNQISAIARHAPKALLGLGRDLSFDVVVFLINIAISCLHLGSQLTSEPIAYMIDTYRGSRHSLLRHSTVPSELMMDHNKVMEPSYVENPNIQNLISYQAPLAYSVLQKEKQEAHYCRKMAV